MKPKAYSYIRFSTKDQIKGDSQRRQAQAAHEYCLAHGLKLSTKKFSDLGISGYKSVERPALKELFTAIEEGKIVKGDYIILENLDRLSRKGIAHTQELLNKIVASGVMLVDLGNSIVLDKNSPNDLAHVLRVAVHADIAYQESLKKSERISSAWKQKQRLALEDKTPKTSRCPAWLKLDKEAKKFIIIESKADIVRRIFAMANNGVGRKKICSILNSENVPTLGKRKAKTWHPSTLQKMLRSRTVIGDLIPTKIKEGKRVQDLENMVEGYYPAVIEADAFYQYQESIKKKPSKGW